MLLFDHGNNSLQWGLNQVMFMKQMLEDDDGGVRIELTPLFNCNWDAQNSFVVTCCVAGMREDEINTRVQQLENGASALVFSGESGVRSVGTKNTYVFKSFQESICLPRTVQLDSMTSLFCDGLLVVTFQKLLPSS
jgi:HSP20 family molecular chaperone IbpA